MNQDTFRQAGRERRFANLELAGLCKRFGEVAAIDGVSLTVQAGEFLTLLGASGSGKSTTLMAVAGFVQPTSGQVLVNGVDQTHSPPYRRDIGLVFQHYALFPHLTVERNVAFPLEMRRMAKADIARRVKGALDLVRLDGFGARKPSELSGGQQQRVAIARALAIRPKLMLFDEPTSALDPELRHEVLKVMRDLAEEGMTMIVVTHEMEFAAKVGSRLLFIDGGKIAHDGPPAELLSNPPSQRLKDFLQHVA